MGKNNTDNLNLLYNWIIDDYNSEVSRKDRLESKANGFYSINGIYLASFLVLELQILEDLKPIKNDYPCLNIANFILVFLYIIIFFKSIKNLHKVYCVKNRMKTNVLEHWNELLNNSFEKTVLSIKITTEKFTEELKKQNDCSANLLKITNILSIVTCVIIVLLFLFVIFLYIEG